MKSIKIVKHTHTQILTWNRIHIHAAALFNLIHSVMM